MIWLHSEASWRMSLGFVVTRRIICTVRYCYIVVLVLTCFVKKRRLLPLGALYASRHTVVYVPHVHLFLQLGHMAVPQLCWLYERRYIFLWYDNFYRRRFHPTRHESNT